MTESKPPLRSILNALLRFHANDESVSLTRKHDSWEALDRNIRLLGTGASKDEALKRLEQARREDSPAEAMWRVWRRRLVVLALLAAVLMVGQTLIVYNPNLLIGALYHGRSGHRLAFDKMQEHRKGRLLYRLCAVYQYLKDSDERPSLDIIPDPHDIPDLDKCRAHLRRP